MSDRGKIKQNSGFKKEGSAFRRKKSPQLFEDSIVTNVRLTRITQAIHLKNSTPISKNREIYHIQECQSNNLNNPNILM